MENKTLEKKLFAYAGEIFANECLFQSASLYIKDKINSKMGIIVTGIEGTVENESCEKYME